MKNSNFTTSEYSPGILSLLPLFYVGWADSLLSPSEVKLIRQKIRSMSFLSKKEIKLLLQWGDPSNPPSRNLFKQWKEVLEKAADEIPEKSRESLVEMGLEMAQKNASGADLLHWRSPHTKNALIDLESSLGIISRKSPDAILNKWDIRITAFTRRKPGVIMS